MYNYTINPKTNEKIPLFSDKGKKYLKNLIINLKGGNLTPKIIIETVRDELKDKLGIVVKETKRRIVMMKKL